MECEAGGLRHDERPEMLVEYSAAVHPPRKIKMLPADDREFPDVFLSVGVAYDESLIRFYRRTCTVFRSHRWSFTDLKFAIARTTSAFEMKTQHLAMQSAASARWPRARRFIPFILFAFLTLPSLVRN
jgi:hypothetical protein